jgi:P2 family phage contractile tail tube protein
MKYPSVIKNFKVYGDQGVLTGAADITLPKITFEKDALKGAGIAGSLNLPVPGNVQPMECVINFHTPTAEALSMFKGQKQQIRCLSSIEYVDTSSGEFDEDPEEIIMGVFGGEYDSNKREPSTKGVVALRFDVATLAIYFAGIAYYQIDPMNGICIFNGVDLNAKTRANIG